MSIILDMGKCVLFLKSGDSGVTKLWDPRRVKHATVKKTAE